MLFKQKSNATSSGKEKYRLTQLIFGLPTSAGQLSHHISDHNNIRSHLLPVAVRLCRNVTRIRKNTGSAEGQIALFTERINHLTEHLKNNRKDYNTERSLVKLVGKRRSLLDYLTKKDVLRYRAIVKELGLRK